MLLIEEIESKCTPEEISEGNYHFIAEKVNIDRTKILLVSIEDIQAYLQTEGAWWIIKATANNSEHPAKAAAEAVMDVANARYKNIDTSLPVVGQMLGGLLATGVLTQVQFDHLTTMGVVPDPVSWEQCQSAVLGV